MAKVKPVFENLPEGVLSDAVKLIRDELKAVKAKLTAQIVADIVAGGGTIPEGKQLIVGGRFGQLAVAIVDLPKSSAKAATPAGSFAAMLAAKPAAKGNGKSTAH